MDDNPRLLDLRRRVHEDPASPVFAQLAEECRRTGANHEAVAVCRSGLEHHPYNLAARVTLGRALMELDRLDEAFDELTRVLDEAPGTLPAIRALAEIYQRRGLMSEALAQYRRALELAQPDAALEPFAEPAAPPAPPTPVTPAAPANIEALFDFDSLLAELGETPAAALAVPLAPVAPPVLDPIPAIELAEDDGDSFAVMERQLRELDEQRRRDEQIAREVEEERRRLLVMRELEEWLSAIVTDRRPRQPA